MVNTGVAQVSLREIIQEVHTLSVDERKELVMIIMDSLADEHQKQHSLSEFRGIGEHLRDMDAQEYVNSLRAEWACPADVE
jgi:hypothetical protein